MRTSFLLLFLLGCTSETTLGQLQSAPDATFTAPDEGARFAEGTDVTFEALVGDATDPAERLTLVWRSSLDGDLPSDPATEDGVATTHAVLQPGAHVVSLTVRDLDGETTTVSRAVTIDDLPDAPEVTVVRPLAGDVAIEGLDVALVVAVEDDLDGPDALVVTVSSDLDGPVCEPVLDALGEGRCTVVLGDGRHLLRFEVRDTQGNVGVAEQFLTVTSTADVDDDGDGFTENQGDCDDTDADTRPGAPEFCDGVDSDCDGLVDDGTDCYDDDGDGWTEDDGDCDDDDAAIGPEAVETWYDGVDSDCDGADDFDADGDGFRQANDCDDTRQTVFPGAPEACNGLDDDCDGDADEGLLSTWYQDSDGDGYGGSVSVEACTAPAGFVGDDNDCYDDNAWAHPGASTYWTVDRGDGSYDYNCDGSSSVLYTDTETWWCESTYYVVGSVIDWDSGWYGGGRPSCGSSRSWASGCDYDENWWIGTFDIHGPGSTSTRTQSCR
jgi:hypothetical protein